MEKIPNFPLDPMLKGLHTGYKFDDRFEILSNPVRRSHSFAFKVRDLEENQTKVVLVIPEQIRRDREAFNYLIEQSQLISVLDHQNIARLYQTHTEGRYAYFEMEHVPGSSLKTVKLKRQTNRLNEEEVKWIAEQILNALEFAHDQNILHRDLKPNNIILTSQRTIKLIDFGLSEPIRQALNLVQDSTASTIILYWSPEQVSGKPLSVRSDIYSLGATLYDLLNGKPPFFTGEVYHCILYQKPEPIEHVSPFMNDLLLKALAKKPEERFQSCQEMRSALQKTGVTVFMTQLSQSPSEKETKKQKRNSLAGTLLKPGMRYSLFSALVIVMLAIIISRLHFKTSEPKTPADSALTKESFTQPDSFRLKMLQALLDQAQIKIDRDQILNPRDNNALLLLEQARKINPYDPQLKRLTGSAKEKIITEAESLVKAGEKKRANEVINTALEFFPDDARLKSLRAKISAPDETQKPLKIEILNGAGERGIANNLSNFLEQNGFDVVNTENFRVNGKVQWNLPKSVFKGNLPKGKFIGKLSKLLRIPYQQDQGYKPQSAKATVTIVLGKDFRSLPPFQK
ncbi:MAG: protein kinase [Calditrichaeota bacterium]|nr:protein kinase [Calditrichota bacterium]